MRLSHHQLLEERRARFHCPRFANAYFAHSFDCFPRILKIVPGQRLLSQNLL